MRDENEKLNKPRRLDRKILRRKRASTAKTVFRLTVILLVMAVILLNVFSQVFPLVRYYGESMEPALTNGQLLVLRKTQEVESGDLVAFYYNNKVLVRRVICEGGNQIEVKTDGSVYINGTELEEPYLEGPSTGLCNTEFPCYVPVGSVFVMGDNRAESMDSRLTEIGSIPIDRIIGKVILAI